MPQDFRYRRLGYVALNVSDVERSADFYREFVGLMSAGQALSGEHLFRCSERHHDVCPSSPAHSAALSAVGEGLRRSLRSAVSRCLAVL